MPRDTTAVACAYAALSVALLGALTVIRPVAVAGGSMRPALSPGDLVFVARSAFVREGDIALISTPPHGPVLHRVISLESDGSVRTRGDANPTADAMNTPAGGIQGRVVGVLSVGAWIERWQAHGNRATLSAQSNSTR